MSPEIVTNVLLQVPALGVVVYLVIHFLSYLRSARDDEREFIARLTKDHSDIIERNTQAMLENRDMANQTREALAQVRVVIEQSASRWPIRNSNDVGAESRA